MKLFIKLAATFLTAVVVAVAVGYFYWYKPKFRASVINPSFGYKYKEPDNKYILSRLQTKASEIIKYAITHHYNTNHCFLVDMNISSGKKRFFVYDLKKNSIEDAGLVAHGCGSDKGEGKLYFSNEINSGCTSLGKYKVGKAYTGRFGLAYKLYGLDSSNTNAIQRFVVLHAYSYVPYEEVAPIGICESRGCPMVAPAFLVVLKDYIDHADKPILLWIFY